ncbi:hypothetical protein [Bifidobacterium leontopitheci]|uniref:DNA-binding protein n=1 Tax=Bifidobacterium leontopitheci TaxID=2650774 RepID=A0A6I1GFZ8_9BIFI|nr:hypothetical protein [Bifidobacterium leontopitheci]KAB7790485.1 DNA-binding protein [Bifidobacterium leontopitheci]
MSRESLERAMSRQAENGKRAPKKSTVIFDDPTEMESDLDTYTVPIPEGLTETFQPSRPVSVDEIFDWEAYGREPYPGYAAEENNWEKAWEKVNRAQQKADGGTMHIADPVHLWG